MKASILAEHPFLIPCGTKMKLTLTDPVVDCGTVFFAGYKTFNRDILADEFDLFARFKKPTKKGEMSNHNIELFDGVVGYSDLKRCEIEILELPDSYRLSYPDPDKYNKLTCAQVSVCTLEMLTIAKKHGLKKISFRDYPSVDAPSATFDNGDTDAYLEVDSIEFDEDIIKINSVAGGGFTGILDRTYGEYFDVAEALPKIYKAFIKAVQTTLTNQHHNA